MNVGQNNLIIRSSFMWLYYLSFPCEHEWWMFIGRCNNFTWGHLRYWSTAVRRTFYTDEWKQISLMITWNWLPKLLLKFCCHFLHCLTCVLSFHASVHSLLSTPHWNNSLYPSLLVTAELSLILCLISFVSHWWNWQALPHASVCDAQFPSQIECKTCFHWLLCMHHENKLGVQWVLGHLYCSI